MLKPPSDRIWADPFVVKKKDSFFIFFEEKLNKVSNAHISCLQFNSAGILKNAKPEIVLKEKHHLSYPFIFLDNGVEYMIPEAADSDELSLYKAAAFPSNWKKIKTLLTGKKIYDATVHFHEGYWYLFCSGKIDNTLSADAYLYIYYTKDIFNEPLLPHPLNPVYRDVRNSRPAGKIFKWMDNLIRPSQVSAPDYGSKIQLNCIKKLSIDHFEEEMSDIISPDWNNKISGIHTINYSEGFSVADIQTRRSKWF